MLGSTNLWCLHSNLFWDAILPNLFFFFWQSQLENLAIKCCVSIYVNVCGVCVCLCVCAYVMLDWVLSIILVGKLVHTCEGKLPLISDLK